MEHGTNPLSSAYWSIFGSQIRTGCVCSWRSLGYNVTVYNRVFYSSLKHSRVISLALWHIGFNLFMLSCCCRWNSSADEPSSCCHRGCSWPLEMCKARSTPVWACPGALLGYSQAQHPAVQQFCITVCLKPSSLPKTCFTNADCFITLVQSHIATGICSFLSV